MHCILLIDDPDVRTLLRHLLADAEYDVIEAGDGHEGLAYCQTRPMGVVLAALLMPEQEV